MSTSPAARITLSAFTGSIKNDGERTADVMFNGERVGTITRAYSRGSQAWNLNTWTYSCTELSLFASNRDDDGGWATGDMHADLRRAKAEAARRLAE